MMKVSERQVMAGAEGREDVRPGEKSRNADTGVGDDVGLGTGRIFGGGEAGLGCLSVEVSGLDGGPDSALFSKVGVQR